MLRVQVTQKENLDKAIKKLKRKMEKAKLIKKFRNKQEFKKPSVVKREGLRKAKIYPKV